MRKDHRLAVTGAWSRGTDYELVQGVIASAPEGHVQPYDPWDVFRANLGAYRTVEQPYVALLELRRQLGDLKRTGVEPTRSFGTSLAGPDLTPSSAADQLIVPWCRDHGLLGLVPVLASRIQLPGQVTPGADAVQTEWQQYFRQGGRWRTHTETTHHVPARPTDLGKATNAAQRAVKAQPPMTTWITWVSGASHDRPTDDLRAYFPRNAGDAARFIPPLPLSPGFWATYGEPVWEFARYCEFFGQAVDALGRSAGLLASYALMFLWDFEAGRRARQCQRCCRYFVSNERRSRYCSSRCRNTMQSRRHRAKKQRSLDERATQPKTRSKTNA